VTADKLKHFSVSFKHIQKQKTSNILLLARKSENHCGISNGMY